jgi:hypothetical protein
MIGITWKGLSNRLMNLNKILQASKCHATETREVKSNCKASYINISASWRQTAYSSPCLTAMSRVSRNHGTFGCICHTVSYGGKGTVSCPLSTT